MDFVKHNGIGFAKEYYAARGHYYALHDVINTARPKPGTIACAQCHVEYYMDSETKEVILPLDMDLEIESIEAYYDEMEYFDWKHPRTGTPLIKVQHTEFETYSGSVHAKTGVTCADCHMPTVEDNRQKYKSHWAKSHLKAINELWNLHRKPQYRWDFVFVENSTGFHNTPKAKKAWGKYWQWGTKETWSFITWIIYSIYLHVRLTKDWKGKKAPINNINVVCSII